MHNKVILRKLHMTTWYSLAELNRIVENMTKILPSSTENPELLLKFVEKLFKSGKKCLEDGDEEMAYVFFLRYLQSYKKAEEQSKLLENYDNSNGPSWSYKARESQRICSNLAINLKERYHLEIMQVSKQLMGINNTTGNEQSSEFKSPLLSSHSFRRKPHTSSRLKGIQKPQTPPPQRTGASVRPTLRDLLTGNNIERSQQHDSSMTEDALSLTLAPEDISDSTANDSNGQNSNKTTGETEDSEHLVPLIKDIKKSPEENEKVSNSPNKLKLRNQEDETDKLKLLQIASVRLSRLKIKGEKRPMKKSLQPSTLAGQLQLQNELTKLSESFRDSDDNTTELPFSSLPSTSSNELVESWLPLSPTHAMPGPNSTDSGEITGSELRKIIDEDLDLLLIIDCQPQEDFLNSHISHPNCINIPPSLLISGMTALEVELRLKGEESPEDLYYIQWKRRWTADRIILYDCDSTFAHQNSSLATLYTALTVFDVDSDDTYQNRVSILHGGINHIKQNFTSVIQPELSEPYPNQQAVEIASLVSVNKSTTSKLKVQDQILKNKIQDVSDLRQLVAKKDIDFKLLREKYDALLATNNTEIESKIPDEQSKRSQTNPSTSTSSKEGEIDSTEKMHRKTEDNKLNAPVVVNKTEGNDKVHEPLPKKQKVIEDGSTHLQSITLKRFAED